MASNGGLCTYPAPVISSPDKLGHEANGHQHTMTSGPPGFMGGHWPEGEAIPPHYPAYPGYEAAPPTPFVINGGQCEAGGGHGVTVTTVPGDGQQPSAASSRGQHTVHFHVHQGEAVSLQLGSEVQMIQGPATVRMVSTSHEPPVPLPIQVPPGHFVHQIVDENGVLQHVILSQHPTIGYPPGVPPGPTPAPMGPAPATTSQNGWQQAGVPGPGQHNGPGYVDPTGAPPPTIQCTAPPPAYWAEGRPSKNSKKRDYADRRYKNG